MTTLLTTSQVADLVGIHPFDVPAWARRHGISYIPGPQHDWYPASTVYDAYRPPAPLRLARFIRNPLNWTVEDRP